MEEGLIGAIIGGLLTGGAQFLSEQLKLGTTRRNLVVALAAEASAVAEVVRRREWLPQLADFATRAKAGEVCQFSVHLPAEIITCTRAAASNAGLLPGRLPGLVARLVMLADGSAVDIRRLADFRIDDERGFLHTSNPAGAERIYSEILAVLVDAVWTCDQIVLEAKRHFPKETRDLVLGKPAVIEQLTRQAMAGRAE